MLLAFSGILLSGAYRSEGDPELYRHFYQSRIADFLEEEKTLLRLVQSADVADAAQKARIREQIAQARISMKGVDFWLRYLDPLAYKKINAPLPVEWETEVFEKFEKPYKRVGAGLTLAELYLEEPSCRQDSLARLVEAAVVATGSYFADSTTRVLPRFSHFLLANRLFLLNLATIYNTGFECPDTSRVIPELKQMAYGMKAVYAVYNEAFPAMALSEDYLNRYTAACDFLVAQPNDLSRFDHFRFVRDYVNPLFALNQRFIRDCHALSASYVDYSLNKEAVSIFDKKLYFAQHTKGIFHRVEDPQVLAEIERLGKLLFFDPILSGNNSRSCASCHHPETGFADTLFATDFQYNHVDRLTRNTPTLLNVPYNHLIMLDGKLISLKEQFNTVVSNPLEMGGSPEEALKKVMSCAEYKKGFNALLVQTPQEKEVTFEHVLSAVIYYYSKFSQAYAPFDDAMDRGATLQEPVVRGFNLFMGKAQCGTCHFLPQFNGVKPPYIGSEFEVLGVPADKQYSRLSEDKGRYEVNPAYETLHAFRTGALRNLSLTPPYMHNGVFNTLEEVVEFYDAGGGAGHGLKVENQTLAPDSLHLTIHEKSDLIAFLRSLDEKVPVDTPPMNLPVSTQKKLNARKVGGDY